MNVEEIIGRRVATDIFGTLPKFLGGFIGSARSNELDMLLQKDPQVKNFVYRSKSYHHPISSGMNDILGFFDREFLKHDFYLGMYDAKKFIEQNYHADNVWERLTLPEGASSLDPTESWKPFACMDGVLSQFDPNLSDIQKTNYKRKRTYCQPSENASDSRTKSQSNAGTVKPCNVYYPDPPVPKCPSCAKDQVCRKPGECWNTAPRDSAAGPNMTEFGKLLQITVERLYNYCSLISVLEDNIENEHSMCHRAHIGEMPPVVPEQKRAKRWHRCFARKELKTGTFKNKFVREGWDYSTAEKRKERFCGDMRKNEGEYQYIMRLLSAHDFSFGDLDLDGALERKRARIHLRYTIDRYIVDLAKNYDEDDGRLPLRVLGQFGMNFLDYVPRRHIVYFTLGRGSEVGWSHAIGARVMRLNLALVLKSSVPWQNDWSMSATPATGPELQIPGISGPKFQLTFGARIGYQISSYKKFDTFTRDACGDEMKNSTRRCSALVFQSFLSLSLLERLRLQIGAEIFPPGIKELAPKKTRAIFVLAIGPQFLPTP